MKDETTIELVALLNKISEESVTTSNVLADILDLLRERLPGRAEVKVAPFDPDLAARNLDAIKHELETPMGEHGECCAPVPRTEPKGAAAASAPLRPGEYILNRDGSAYRVVGTSEPGGDDEALADAEAERDGWKAKYAALRADVDEFQYKHRAYPGTWELVDALARHLTHLDDDDTARTPQPDPDTVTLRRDDVEDILATARVCGVTEDRVRKALGWGDSDDT